MTPNTKSDATTLERLPKLVAPQAAPRIYELIYMNLLTFAYWHLAGAYGLYLCFTSAKWTTILFNYLIFILAEIGVTAGAHRLWAHQSFKAKLPLEIMLMIFNSMAFQNTATNWVRDHRMHHKYSDTDGDPHNATRGFFFSHIGWLLVKKHPELIKRGKNIYMTDIYNNPVLKFQKKYAIPILGTFCFILPTFIPFYIWGETLNNAWHIAMLRYLCNLHITFLVNSVVHIWGYKTYDKNIMPTQNLFISGFVFGEGFHNYHHTFPWDYRSSELGNNKLNVTTKLIDFFAWLGLAYDLKTVKEDVILKRRKRTGDGTNLWGNVDESLYDENEFYEGKELVILLVSICSCAIAIEKLTHIQSLVQLSHGGKNAAYGEVKHHIFLYKLYKGHDIYKAFCSGNIISPKHVLTSAHCVLSNRKKYTKEIDKIKLVAGTLEVTVNKTASGNDTQWRKVKHVYSQKYYRFPAFSLAVMKVHHPWILNNFINVIPLASLNQDFDGICMATAVRTKTSWSATKVLFFEEMRVIPRATCQSILQKSCRLYYCTDYDKRNALATGETEGGGLVCHGTGDPEEVLGQGILVGVTTLINVRLPTLHNRVGLFRKWIDDGSVASYQTKLFVILVQCLLYHLA